MIICGPMGFPKNIKSRFACGFAWRYEWVFACGFLWGLGWKFVKGFEILPKSLSRNSTEILMAIYTKRIGREPDVSWLEEMMVFC